MPFDVTSTDNDFWEAQEFFTAKPDMDGLIEFIEKFTTDWSKATIAGGAGDKSKATLQELQDFLALQKPVAINMLKHIKEVVIAGVKMKAYLNWSTSKTLLWDRALKGKLLWLTLGESDLTPEAYKTLMDTAKEIATQKAKILTLEADLHTAQAELALEQKKPKVSSVAALNKKIKDLEAAIAAGAKAKVQEWNKKQQDEVAALLEPIQEGLKCCYADSAERQSQIIATHLQLLEWKGDEAFKDAVRILKDFASKCIKPSQDPDNQKPHDCAVFDMDEFNNAWTPVWDKWRSIDGAPSTQGPAGSKSWYNRMVGPVAAWWKARRDKAVVKRTSSVAGPAKSYLGQVYQNWWHAVRAPFDGFARDDGENGLASWTLGLLSSVISFPFTTLATLFTVVVADGPSKLLRGQTLTKSWSGSWFGGVKTI